MKTRFCSWQPLPASFRIQLARSWSAAIYLFDFTRPALVSTSENSSVTCQNDFPSECEICREIRFDVSTGALRSVYRRAFPTYFIDRDFKEWICWHESIHKSPPRTTRHKLNNPKNKATTENVNFCAEPNLDFLFSKPNKTVYRFGPGQTFGHAINNQV